MADLRTLVELFRRSVNKYPDKTALIFYGKKFSYRQLDELSDRAAELFRRLGVRWGDRIAFVSPNTPHVPIAFLAAWKLGAVVAAVNPLETKQKIVEMLKLADPKVILVLENFKELIEMISEDKELDSAERCRISFSIADYLPLPHKILYRLKTRKWSFGRFRVTWIKAMKAAPVLHPDYRKALLLGPGPKDLAVLQFTGGTTGTTKAAMLSQQNLSANAMQAIRQVNKEETIISEDMVFLGAIPFFHVYGLTACMNMAFSLGGTVVLLPKFDSKEIFKTICKYRVGAFPGIPVMFTKLADCAAAEPEKYQKMCETLKVCISGAGAINESAKNRFEELTGAKIVEGYGLSEASPVVSVNPVRGAKIGSLGLPLPDTEVKIVDGELWVRGPQVMAGYWRNEKETKEVLKEDGWLTTGDMVNMDNDGFLWFVDRKKDMIKVLGENVYSREIEKVIATLPSVADVAVIGLPDSAIGCEKIVACVVLRNWPIEICAADVITHCRAAGLRTLKTPKEVIFVDEIPKNIIGKILKRELKAKLLKAETSS